MKADLAIAIIARDAGKTLGACLDSIVPHVTQVVVAVDERSTDDTAAIALRHGARVVTGHKVSDWHECDYHGRVLAQHFANARNESFRLLRNDVEWWGWIDSDDVVKGGEKLAEMLAETPADVAGYWLPYDYSQVHENGPVATQFDRERIVRRSIGWQWLHRVHEVLAPIEGAIESLEWRRREDVRIIHQGLGHDTAGSARRNILLLEIDLEENPDDKRAQFYMGNQYFALGEFAEAARWFGMASDTGNTYQAWQNDVYLSMACEKMGDMDGAIRAAHAAIEQVPYHPEPYWRLAAIAMLTGDLQRCQFWISRAKELPDPPFFIFRNPLDRTYNAPVMLGQAYMNAGLISRAKREYLKALEAIPKSEVIRQGIQQISQMEEETTVADSYVKVLERVDDKASLPIPAEIWKFGRVRDVVVPALLAARPNTQPRLLIWCGRSSEPWAPPSIDTTGIGGSETAVIQIARRFAADGWRVDVYNEPDRLEGEYEGVGYWGLGRLGRGENADVLVSWRNPSIANLPVHRVLSILWCHDLNYGPRVSGDFARWDRVLGVSAWHADYLSNLYESNNTTHAPNGIDHTRFSDPVKKIPFRCVYGSSPDRGLDRLLRMWPDIVANEPSAELHVAYGWENIDKLIAMGHEQLAAFKAEVQGLIEKTPGVVWRGRLPQNELAKLYQQSYAWMFPTSFTEVSCITAMEAMAAGCVPVTSETGALPETIGDGGLIVTGNTYTQSWKEFYVQCAKAALQAPDVRIPLMQKGMERARLFTWDRAYEAHWKPLVTGLLERSRERELVEA